MTTNDISTPTPASEVGPQTYEDCIGIIETAQAATDIADTKAALSKVHGFFKSRVGKRKSESARDGGDAVKSALAASRRFQPFTSKPVSTGVPS